MLYLCGIKLLLIDEVDSKVVVYVCLWEGKYSGAKFLHLSNFCYHMVVSSGEVYLSIFEDIRM